MRDGSFDRVKHLFLAARSLTKARRESFVREQEVDTALVEEVLALLASSAATEDVAVGRDGCEMVGDRIGPYLLLAPIGEGGFGVVFAAEQSHPLVRQVALKVIKAGMDSRQVIARFEQERRALALMDHPNIARVFDAGTTPSGRPYFVMELVRGLAITEYCDRERLPLAARLRLFVDVGRAVQHAHQKGVIHRDLKPSNVLVTIVDGCATPKIIDFGVAKAIQGRIGDVSIHTEQRQIVGTPLYMSPEQARTCDAEVDTRSDVYSLGVVLYELLTGLTPFAREELLDSGLDEMLRLLCEVDPPKPSIRVAEVGCGAHDAAYRRHLAVERLPAILRGELDWIVMRCLAKEPERRYGSVGDLVQDVLRHLAGQPVMAAPPSAAYQLRKLVRRHRVGLAAAFAVAAALVVGGGSAVWQARRRVEVVEAMREAECLQRYVACIQGAVAALHGDDVASARAWLAAAPEPLRLWEWQHLMARCDGSEHALLHADRVLAVDYSGDGERLATLSADGSASVFDARKGQLLATIAVEAGRPKGLDVDRTGRRIVVVSSSGEASVVDVMTGLHIARLGDDGARVVGAVFGPDDERIVTWTEQGSSHIWRAPTWQIERQLDAMPGVPIHGAEWRGDGMRLLTWSAERLPHLWNPSTGELVAVLRGHDGRILDAHFREGDDESIATWSLDAFCLWHSNSGAKLSSTEFAPWSADIRNGLGPSSMRSRKACADCDGEMFVAGRQAWIAWESVNEGMLQHRDDIVFADYLPGGMAAVTASSDATARLWEPGTDGGECTPKAVFLGHVARIAAAALRPDGKQLATASDDCTCRLWNLEVAGPSPRRLGGSLDVLCDLRISPNGAHVLACARNTVEWIDVASGDLTMRVIGDEFVRTVAWAGPELCAALAGRSSVTLLDRNGDTFRLHEDGDGTFFDLVASPLHVVAAGEPGVRIWAAATRQLVATLDTPCIAVACSRDGSRLAFGRADGSLELRRAEALAVPLWGAGHDSAIRHLAFDARGERLVVASKSRMTTHEVATGRLLARWDGELTQPVLNPEGTVVVAWSPQRLVALDAVRGHEIATLRRLPMRAPISFGLASPPYSFAPDGRRLLLRLSDRRGPTLWDTASWREMMTLDHAVAGENCFAEFSPDGSWIVTSRGLDVTMWDSLPVAERLRRGELSAAVAEPISLSLRLQRERQIQEWAFGMGQLARFLVRAPEGDVEAARFARFVDAVETAVVGSNVDWLLQALVVVRYRQGRMEEASQAVVGLERRCGSSAFSNALRARIAVRMDDRAAAEAALARLLAYDPDQLGVVDCGVSLGQLQALVLAEVEARFGRGR